MTLAVDDILFQNSQKEKFKKKKKDKASNLHIKLLRLKAENFVISLKSHHLQKIVFILTVSTNSVKT